MKWETEKGKQLAGCKMNILFYILTPEFPNLYEERLHHSESKNELVGGSQTLFFDTKRNCLTGVQQEVGHYHHEHSPHI